MYRDRKMVAKITVKECSCGATSLKVLLRATRRFERVMTVYVRCLGRACVRTCYAQGLA